MAWNSLAGWAGLPWLDVNSRPLQATILASISMPLPVPETCDWKLCGGSCCFVSTSLRRDCRSQQIRACVFGEGGSGEVRPLNFRGKR